MNALILFPSIAAILLLQGGVALLAAPLPETGPYWVIASPWTDIDTLVTESGGYPIGPRPPHLGRLVHGLDADLGRRLRENGALLVVSQAHLASLGCSTR